MVNGGTHNQFKVILTINTNKLKNLGFSLALWECSKVMLPLNSSIIVISG